MKTPVFGENIPTVHVPASYCGMRTGARPNTLRYALCALCCIVAPVLLGACSSVDTTARSYAEQNENAVRRQQAEQEQPRIDNQQVYMDMIREMQGRWLYFASLAHIDAYLKIYENTPDIQLLRADALRATGQPDAAETQYRTLLATKQAAAAWHGLGLLAGQRGDYATAITDFRTALQADPANAAMLSDLGYALLQRGDRNAARLPLMQAIELMPDNHKIASNLTLYLLLSNDQEKADAVMSRVGFSDEVKTEILRQATQLGATVPSVHAQDPAAAPPLRRLADHSVTPRTVSNQHRSDDFMRPMLQRFGDTNGP